MCCEWVFLINLTKKITNLSWDRRCDGIDKRSCLRNLVIFLNKLFSITSNHMFRRWLKQWPWYRIRSWLFIPDSLPNFNIIYITLLPVLFAVTQLSWLKNPPISLVGDIMSELCGINANNLISLGYISVVILHQSSKRCPESLNAPMMTWLCSSAVSSFEMMEPDMQIVRNLLSLVMVDNTTLTIDTWHLDVSSVWSCLQFLTCPSR